MKEIKDDLKGWRDNPCSWVGKINTVFGKTNTIM